MIKQNLDRIRERIQAACLKTAGCQREIKLVSVTKGQSAQNIGQLLALGYKDIGENRVQEALEKSKIIKGARWHMIGHLQTNKVKDALKIFELIHSVDSFDLAKEISKQALKIGKCQEILLEVKTSPEPSKFGFAAGELAGAWEKINKLENIKVNGLMTIAPYSADASEIRRCFALTRQLRDNLNPEWSLSMGMSDDFEIAIEEGADIIRIGRAVFNG